MKKKKLLICSVIAVVVLTVGGVAAHELISPATERWLKAAQKTKPDSPKTVIAVVDGEEISRETIDAAMIGEEIMQKNSGKSEPVDPKEVLQKHIRTAVVFHQAVQLGLEADYETAKVQTEESYRLVMQENGENAAFLRKYMAEMQLTEEEYLEFAISAEQKSLTRTNLYFHFTEEMKATDEEKREAYEKYVDDLVAKADIQILSKEFQ